MVRLLVRIAVFLGSAALGLWVASLLIEGVGLHLAGFIVAVVVFALVQALLAPLIAKLVSRYAKAFLGGVGLISTLVALVVATLVGNGLSMTGGVSTWVLATLVVWLVTAVATVLLPVFVRPGKPGTARRATAPGTPSSPG